MAGFYYLWHDHPADVDGLVAAIHQRQREAFALLAQGPCEVIVLVENTSSYYISPQLYRRHNGPHVAEYVEAVHQAGKVAVVHMCGHVRGLLEQIRDTGLDGVHALTPPPTGDTPWELALDVLGEEIAIVGALDPTVFATGPLEAIPAELDRVYTPRLRRAHFVLGPFADGIPVPVERFQAVQRWMERHGALAG
jgi:uroporphyrinogen-III decarboxylase